jgi:hypothetical protein
MPDKSPPPRFGYIPTAETRKTFAREKREKTRKRKYTEKPQMKKARHSRN